MNRRRCIINIILSTNVVLLPPYVNATNTLKNELISLPKLTKKSSGKNFIWAVTCAVFQVKSGCNADGKVESISDSFVYRKRKISCRAIDDIAADFYHRYIKGICLHKEMNFDTFRVSISWSIIFPKCTGKINPSGIDFYNKIIDPCLANNLQSRITLYLRYLTQNIEKRGGWKLREIVDCFSQYADFVIKIYGVKVKNGKILSEPLSITALDYMRSEMAPGYRKFGSFFSAVQHAVLCQAKGGRIIRRNVRNTNVGTTFATLWVNAVNTETKNIKAARPYNALINLFFVNSAVGLGYTFDRLPGLKKMKFNFFGLQNYYHVSVKKKCSPFIKAKEIPASHHGVKTNCLSGEINNEDFYKLFKQFGIYKIPLVFTKNGVCFKDTRKNDFIHAQNVVVFLKDYLPNLLKFNKKGIDILYYFYCRHTDNFVWDKGYCPHFGLGRIDNKNKLKIVIKDSVLCSDIFFKDAYNIQTNKMF